MIDGIPWYGPSLLKSLQEIPASFWNQKPKGVSHSIAELVYHIIDWKVFVVEKLKGNKTYNIEMNSEKDWRESVSVSNENEKKQLIEKIKNTQSALIEILKAKTVSWLNEFVPGRDYKNLYMVNGLVQHDIYHLGQINMLYAQLKH